MIPYTVINYSAVQCSGDCGGSGTGGRRVGGSSGTGGRGDCDGGSIIGVVVVAVVCQMLSWRMEN